MFDHPPRFSKALTAILALALVLAVSLLGTTLASYVKEAGLFGNGWVGPKYYAFEVESSGDRHALAPGESAAYAFTVKNYNSGGFAQVPLNVLVHATYPSALAGTGRVLAELRQGGTVLGSSDSGTLECPGAVLSANSEDSDSYTLVLTWLDADMALLGSMKDSAFEPQGVNIRVSGYQ